MFKVGLLVLVGLLNISAALIVLSRNARRPLNITFAILTTAVALWVWGVAAFLHTNQTSAALAWAQFLYITPLLIVLSSVAFADVFPSGGKIQKLKLGLVSAGFLALALPIAVSPDFLFSGIAYHDWGKQVLLHALPYTFYSLYLAIAFALTIATIYRKTKTEHGVYRAQAAVFLVGYSLSCVLGVFFNLFLPAIGYYQFIWVGSTASTLYIIATAYGIVRHKLFDVRLVAARAVGYILSISVLGTAYGVLAFVLAVSLLGVDVTSFKERAVYAALAVLAALTFPATKRFFDRITNKLFYQDAYDSQAFLDQLNKVLVTNIELRNLLTQAAMVINTNLKADYTLFAVKEADSQGPQIFGTVKKGFLPKDVSIAHRLPPQLSQRVIVADDLEEEHVSLRQFLLKNDIAMIARLAPENGTQGEALGHLIVGSKRSGNPYTSQDVKLIGIIAQELFIAVQNALRFEEINQFNITLQQKVDDATRKLRHTNEKLRQLDQIKDDFISMASHQLRTPLTSVKGYVSMVLDEDAGKITPMQRKLLNQSFISAQRMVYLISDLLNVSRLKTGKFVIEPVPSNLAKVVKDEVDQLQETAKGRNLELTFNRPEYFPTLLFDETKLRQVIMNFIDNAIYYTPSGGHIAVSLIDKPQSIELTVTDDGIGVARDEQHHLFTKFFRAQNAKRARPDGTGLGLFMAKKVVVAQGGALIFKSQEGKGSTFGFTFPKKNLTQLGKLLENKLPADDRKPLKF